MENDDSSSGIKAIREEDSPAPELNKPKTSKKLSAVIVISIVLLILVIVGIIIYFNGIAANNLKTSDNKNSTTSKIRFEGKYIDVHAHISTKSMLLSDIIRNMDAQGIDKMVIMKPPASIPTNKPQANYEIPDAAVQFPSRFIALYGGEAVAMLEQAAISGKYTNEETIIYTNLLEKEMKSDTYSGIGEIGLRHFVAPNEEKKNVAYDLTIPGDHPWMFIMSDIAAKYDVPIDVHMEATAESVKGLEKLLDHNINTKIIWDHAGWSQLATKTALYSDMATPELMNSLMSKHPNLYASIKIRKEEVSSPISIFTRSSEIPSGWITVLMKYPDRFMIGSDIKPGIVNDQFRMINDTKRFLNRLPSEILKRIERENAEKIFK